MTIELKLAIHYLLRSQIFVVCILYAMFYQVEDKRIAAERQLISLQTKYSSLDKAYKVAKQQINKHKVIVFIPCC